MNNEAHSVWLHGSVGSVGAIEQFLLATKTMKLIHDGAVEHEQFGGQVDSAFYIRTYKFIFSDIVGDAATVKFIYDHRNGKAKIRVTQAGIQAFMRSFGKIWYLVEDVDGTGRYLPH